MTNHNKKIKELDRDIQNRFKKEKKYVIDPVNDDKGNRFFVIATSIVMIGIVIVSIVYTLLSMLK
ncbi:hypothetical protein ACFQ22_01540 [Lentilactobacillus raoultii]|uniref:Uncharacterized protein n=1 Tax=Lentilactobacillus raoultii TaxID=1987503 RepID=A0ABW3PGK3_9LACO|nr:hypothetical protein [Lentilactobacillus raoultii]